MPREAAAVVCIVVIPRAAVVVVVLVVIRVGVGGVVASALASCAGVDYGTGDVVHLVVVDGDVGVVCGRWCGEEVEGGGVFGMRW